MIPSKTRGNIQINQQQKVELKSLRGESKISRLKIKPDVTAPRLAKPSWIRIQIKTSQKVNDIKNMLRSKSLSTVCEEASCPNLSECFSAGTATFMIMGDICTRRCPFCDVAHGRPNPLDTNEPLKLAESIKKLSLKYVVITSVDRDDLIDGGGSHFAECIKEIRLLNSDIVIEILVPDFRGKMDKALDSMTLYPPDVFNHNLETVSELYPKVRPGSNYEYSLNLIKKFKALFPQIPTKSGLMLGVGETRSQLLNVLKDLREHHCDRITLGQYLQPSKHHLAVERYLHPDEFIEIGQIAEDMGFKNVASGVFVRSSYHADLQHAGTLKTDVAF